jgi:hypothetical protein
MSLHIGVRADLLTHGNESDSIILDGKSSKRPSDAEGGFIRHDSDDDGRHQCDGRVVEKRLTEEEVVEGGWTEENKLRRREGGLTDNHSGLGDSSVVAHLKPSMVCHKDLSRVSMLGTIHTSSFDMFSRGRDRLWQFNGFVLQGTNSTHAGQSMHVLVIFILVLGLLFLVIYSIPPLSSIENGERFVWRPSKVEDFRLDKDLMIAYSMFRQRKVLCPSQRSSHHVSVSLASASYIPHRITLFSCRLQKAYLRREQACVQLVRGHVRDLHRLANVLRARQWHDSESAGRVHLCRIHAAGRIPHRAPLLCAMLNRLVLLHKRHPWCSCS